MPTTRKAGTIDELTDALGKAQLTIVTDYRGLKVSDLQGFRAALRPKGAEFRVAKNTLTNIAAGKAGVEGFDGMLEGPTGLVIVYEDIVGASKVVNDFIRTSRILSVKGAVMNNRPLSAADVEALATLPSREELQARLLGLMVSPMSRTLGILGGPARSMVYLLNAKASEGGAAAAD